MDSPLKLSTEQSERYSDILDWIDGRTKEASLTGYAGSGKTSLISELLRAQPFAERMSTLVVAPTGRAASVLTKKLAGLIQAKTIHSAMYAPLETFDGTLEFIYKGIPEDIRLVICDEASMVSNKLYEDMTNSRAKFLFVGDPGQLPPVASKKGFSALDQSTNFHLEEIHRQAADSPIISLAHKVRNGGKIPLRASEAGVVITRKAIVRKNLEEAYKTHDIIICGYNSTRRYINDRCRAIDGLRELLEVGDWLCVTSNNREVGVYNGERYQVTSIKDNTAHREYRVSTVSDWGHPKDFDIYLLTGDEDEDTAAMQDLKEEGKTTTVPVDYGYAITAHKSQGSEWDKVLLLNEPISSKKKWEYTAITRASEHLTWAR